VVSIQLTPTRQVNCNFNQVSKVLSLEGSNLINPLIIREIAEAGIHVPNHQYDSDEVSLASAGASLQNGIHQRTKIYSSVRFFSPYFPVFLNTTESWELTK